MSQVQVTLTFANIDIAIAALTSLAGTASYTVVSTDKAAPTPGKSAPTPPTKSADAKPSAEKPKAPPPAAAPVTPPIESSGPTLQNVTDAISAALKPGPQMRTKVVAVLAEFKTAEDGPVTNAKVLQAKDYAEFLMKLKIAVDPGAAATEDALI